MDQQKQYYPDHFCACGCGTRLRVSLIHKYKGIPKYISGHNSRGTTNPMHGVQRFGSENPFWRKRHTKVFIKKQRLARLGKSWEEVFGVDKAKTMREQKRILSAGKNNPNWQGGPVNCICKTCKQPFHKDYNEVKKGWGKYCSLKCRNIANSVYYSGENSVHWKGGLSGERYGSGFTPCVKEQIRKRDKYKCGRCGISQKKLGYTLHVHHGDYNKQNNDPENLFSLCKPCHSQTNGKRSYWTKYFQRRHIGGNNESIV